MKARIRDFFETRRGWIFAVADYYHPRGLRSLLRYVPDPQGERIAFQKRYRKMDFDQSFDFLIKNQPDYVRDLHVVPLEDITRFFLPAEGLERVAKEDDRVKKIVDILMKGGIPRQEMGITGSMLLGLNGPSSDIDYVVYGPWWWKARDIIAAAKETGSICDLDMATWEKIYSKRKPEIGLEEFIMHEKRKGNRGMVDGTYFDLLFTRDWSQIGLMQASGLKGRPQGRCRIEASVLDAEFAFDSPAVYHLDHKEVAEIYCYSHTYAGQVLPGERVEAQGVLEETASGLRLVVGTTREAKGEWIRSITLLEGGR